MHFQVKEINIFTIFAISQRSGRIKRRPRVFSKAKDALYPSTNAPGCVFASWSVINVKLHHPGIDVHTSARARIRLGADTSHAPNHKRVVCRFTKAKFGPMQKSELPTDQCSIVSARVELAVPQVEIEVYPFHFLPKSAKRAEIHENSRFLRSQRAAWSAHPRSIARIVSAMVELGFLHLELGFLSRGLISFNWAIFTSAPFNSVIYYAKISKSLNKPGTARGLVRCALSICVVYYCNDKISWRDTFVFCSNKHENFDVNFWLEPSKIQGRVEKPLALVANTLPVVVFFLVLVFVQVLFRVARTSPKCVWRKSISCTVYRWKIYISKYLWTICTNPDANTILNINACRDGALKKTLKKCERRTWK